jgi:predicted dehydrogenase
VLRVAIVGCGKIADQHVQATQRVAGSKVVAVCDRELMMARQLAERFAIEGCYDEVGRMLAESRPDVVHLTTPPQGRLDLALACLEAGCHVYVEKPFTVTAAEAEAIVAAARRCGRSITAGHNYQFSFEMLRMRKLIDEGWLGGAPVHVESHWSYDLGDASYVGPLLGNRDHWVRKLPGGLLHNIVSHGIARLAEFLDDELTDVIARAHQSERLRAMGGDEVLDELRVLMRDRKGTTATFCFSTQIKPGINQLRVFGPKNSLSVDLNSGSVILHPGRSYKSYLTYLVPPMVAAREHLASGWRNLMGILRQDIYQDSGMTALIARFHATAAGQAAPPIPYRELLLTARIMDSIFASMREAGPGLTTLSVAEAPPAQRTVVKAPLDQAKEKLA